MSIYMYTYLHVYMCMYNCTCMYMYMYVYVLVAIVPDLHIEGTLEAIHAMLDKPQLELIKGLIDMNLGEPIEEFEKPSTVIRDPIAQVSVTLWKCTPQCSGSESFL